MGIEPYWTLLKRIEPEWTYENVGFPSHTATTLHKEKHADSTNEKHDLRNKKNGEITRTTGFKLNPEAITS